MNQAIDPEAFRRSLRERGKTAEELRDALGMSYSTLAKLNGGEPVADAVFVRIVKWLQEQPVLPIAQALLPPSARPAGAVSATERSA